jgi:hypothetical protein
MANVDLTVQNVLEQRGIVEDEPGADEPPDGRLAPDVARDVADAQDVLELAVDLLNDRPLAVDGPAPGRGEQRQRAAADRRPVGGGGVALGRRGFCGASSRASRSRRTCSCKGPLS